MPDPPIETPRLSLVPLSARFMRAAVAHRADAMSRQLGGVRIPDGWPGEDEDVLHLRLGDLARDPSSAPWLVRAVVLRDAAEMIGHAGFHGPPDARGVAELGYTIFEAHRRRGFAEEAARGLMGWGSAKGARGFRASISPGNAPSLATAAKLGFVRTGSQMDEIDGLELVFERLGAPEPR